jgi:hypothetical protein
MSSFTPPSVAPTAIKPPTRAGFWAGLSLGIVLGFAGGLVVVAKCPPDTVPASTQVPEAAPPVAVPAAPSPVAAPPAPAVVLDAPPVPGSVKL